MRPAHIGRYEVLETLARGGMGVVYKARDPLIDRVVAIKTLGMGLSPIEAETFHRRFAREAKSAGKLNHRNIITIHDMGESEEGAYIAMEYLPGRSLRDLLDAGAVLPPEKVADIGVQVAEGLAYAHQHEIVHCDIKPGNVMVLEDGTVKITDFGIARLPTGSRTFAGNVLGSPRYISPEQIVGRPVDARSDLFSLGAVIYEMLTGVPPFDGTSIDEILFQVINDTPQAPSERNASLPREFDAIVARAMSKAPDDRYESAAALAAALRPLAQASAVAVVPLPPVAPAPAQPGAVTVEIEPRPEAASWPAGPRPSQPVAEAALARRRLLVTFTTTTALALVAGAWGLWMYRSGGDAPATIATRPAAQGTSVAPLSTPVAVVPPPAVAGGEATGGGENAASGAGREGDAVAVSAPAASPAGASAAHATPRPTEPARAVAATPPPPVKPVADPTRGRIDFAVSPWGEVYVDGQLRGVVPPMTELKLPAGRYQVELRNPGSSPYRTSVDVTAGEPVRIRHKFQ